MNIAAFLKSTRDEVFDAVNWEKPWTLVSLNEEENLRRSLDQLQDYHIEYLLAAYRGNDMLPPLDFVLNFLRRDSKAARRTALQVFHWFSSVPDEVVDEIMDMIVTTSDSTDRGLAAQALAHLAKSQSKAPRK